MRWVVWLGFSAWTGCIHVPPTAPAGPDGAALAQLRAENRELQAAVSDQQSQIRALESELTTCDRGAVPADALARCDARRAELRSRLEQSRAQNAQLQDRVTRLERRPTLAAYDQSLARIAELERALHDRSDDDELVRLRRRVQGLRRELADTQAERDQLGADLAQGFARLQELERSLERSRGRVAALTRNEQQAEREANQLRNRLAALRADYDRACADLEQAQAEIDRLRNAPAAPDPGLRRQLTQARERITELEEQIAAAPSADELARLQARAKELRRRLERARKRISELEDQIAAG